MASNPRFGLDCVNNMDIIELMEQLPGAFSDSVVIRMGQAVAEKFKTWLEHVVGCFCWYHNQSSIEKTAPA